MEYEELLDILNREELQGQCHESDIDLCILGIEDEKKRGFVTVNSVEFSFRGITLGLQKPSDEAWLLFTGGNYDKAIQIKNIETIVFNFKGYRVIHG